MQVRTTSNKRTSSPGETLPQIDPRREKLLPLTKVNDWLAERGSKRLHPSAIYRWALNGLEGVKLPTIAIGSTLHTSEDALAEFFAAVTERRAHR